MANKDKLEMDKPDLDDELDLDFFNLGDVDEQANTAVKSKSRAVVDDVFKGSIKGVKDSLFSPASLGTFLKDALPGQYGEVFTAADASVSSLSKLYDDSIKEVAPQVRSLADKVDRLVPESATRTKGFLSKFTDKGYESSRPSPEEMQERAIETSINTVFESQTAKETDVAARTDVNSKIQEVIENKRFNSSIGALNQISDSVSRLTQYTTTATQAYQRKSLELQYRSFYVQSDLLKKTSMYYEVFKTQNEGIVKNTALPEYVKTKDRERFLEQSKSRAFRGIQEKMFGENSLIGNFTANVTDKVKQGVAGFKSGAEAGLGGLEQLDTLKEMNALAEELGGEKATKTYTAFNAAGAGVGGYLRNKAADTVNDHITEDSDVSRFGYKAATYLKDPTALREDIANSKYATDEDAVGSKALRGFIDLLGDRSTDNSVGVKDELAVEQETAADSARANKSLVEVIPGYLSKILREVTIIRTGDEETPTTLFDKSSSKFVTDKEMSTTIADRISDKLTGGSYAYRLNDATKSLVGDANLNAAQSESVKTFLSDLAGEDGARNASGVLSSKAFANSESKELLQNLVNGQIGDNAKNTAAGNYKFTSKLTELRKAAPNVRGDIEEFIKNGYSDILTDQGLITPKEHGDGYDVNMEKYKELLKANTIVSSDVNVKRNISKLKPSAALGAIKKTKLYNWMYKTGKGDQEPHTGPMAQDVEANMGDDAAPGGTTIDLTTMNGINMSAIQELQKRQDEISSTDDSQNYLAGIKSDTEELVRLVTAGVGTPGNTTSNSVGGSPAKGPGAIGKLMNIGKGAVDYSTKVLHTGSDLASGLFGGVIKPAAGKLKDVLKDRDVAGSLKNLVTKSVSLAGTAVSKFQEGLKRTVPPVVKTLMSGAKKAKGFVSDRLEQATDLYVAGMKTPALRFNLLKAGYYKDELTGKVIKTYADIKGPVIDRAGNVVLNLEDLSKGIVDNKGKKLQSIGKKVFDLAFNTLAKGYGRLREFGKGFKLGGAGNGLGGLLGKSFSERSYEVLVEIRNLMSGNTSESSSDAGGAPARYSGGSSGSMLGSGIMNRARSAKNKVSDMTTKMTGKHTGGKTSFLDKAKSSKIGTKLSGAKRSVGRVLSSKLGGKGKGLTGLASKVFSKGGAVKGLLKAGVGMAGGALGSMLGGGGSGSSSSSAVDETPDSIVHTSAGSVKGNKASDRFRREEAREKAKKDKFVSADLDLRYKNENGVSSLLGKAGGLISMLTSGAGSVLDIASTAMGAGGFLSGGKKLLGKGLNKAKNLFGKGGKAITGASKLKNVVKPLANVKKLATGAKVLRAAATVKNIATVGSIAAASTTSGILGAITSVGSAIASVVSAPALAIAAGVAVVAYGAYKGYQYATRDKLDRFEKIRLSQYGLTITDKDKEHNHTLLALEEYLNDGRVGYRKGQAYLLEKKIDPKELLDIFSIDPSDSDRGGKFSTWLRDRFTPFFLMHKTALFKADNKAGFSDIPKLKSGPLGVYLSGVGYDSGPYGVTTSPFNDTDNLPDTLHIAKAFITTALTTVVKKSADKLSKGEIIQRMKQANKSKKSADVSTSDEVEQANKKAKDILKDRKTNKIGEKPKVVSTVQNAVKATTKSSVTPVVSKPTTVLESNSKTKLTPTEAKGLAMGRNIHEFGWNSDGAATVAEGEKSATVASSDKTTAVVKPKVKPKIGKIDDFEWEDTEATKAVVKPTVVVKAKPTGKSDSKLTPTQAKGIAMGRNIHEFGWNSDGAATVAEAVVKPKIGKIDDFEWDDTKAVVKPKPVAKIGKIDDFEWDDSIPTKAVVKPKPVAKIGKIDDFEWDDTKAVVKPKVVSKVKPTGKSDSKLTPTQARGIAMGRNIHEFGWNSDGAATVIGDSSGKAVVKPKPVVKAKPTSKSDSKLTPTQARGIAMGRNIHEFGWNSDGAATVAEGEKSATVINNTPKPSLSPRYTSNTPKPSLSPRYTSNTSGSNRSFAGGKPSKPSNIIPFPVKTTKSKDDASTGYVGEEGVTNDTPETSAPADSTFNAPKLVKAPGPFKSGENGFSYIKLQPGVTLDGVNPALLENFKGMAEEYGEMTGKSLQVNSGYRSTALQKKLYKANPHKAARPGRSLHEFGLALDINTVDLNRADKLGLMRKYGFTRPVGGETWHTEPAGLQTNIPAAKKDPGLAGQLIHMSRGKGGGGVATVSSAPKGKRNNKYARSLMVGGDIVAKADTTKDDAVMSGGSSSSPAVSSDKDMAKSKLGMVATSKPASNVIPNSKSVSKSAMFNQGEKYDKISSLPDIEDKPPATRVKAIKTAERDSVVQPPVQLAYGKTKPAVVAKRTIDSVQQSGMSGLAQGIGSVDTTLGKSLSIQEEMLNTLKTILESVDPTKFKEIEETLTASAASGGGATELPKAAVSLKHKFK